MTAWVYEGSSQGEVFPRWGKLGELLQRQLVVSISNTRDLPPKISGPPYWVLWYSEHKPVLVSLRVAGSQPKQQ